MTMSTPVIVVAVIVVAVVVIALFVRSRKNKS